MLLIDTLADLEDLVRRYPNPTDDSTWDESRHFPNWPAIVADGWDAVYLTRAGALACIPQDPDRQATRPHLEGWPAATVLWLRPAYTVADGLGL
ncbi:hypothetical protein BU198_25625 [Streptomyces sp. CBMA156]|nr:hypothetical protein [Streptomyces sp. CBMA156]